MKSDKIDLLFNNSGMAPLYSMFYNGAAGVAPLCNIQKCIRLGGRHNDYLNIGLSKRHLSLFEMMGGFSFGNYDKLYAIQLVWEFLARLSLDVSKLVITVHATDLSTIALWKSVVKSECNVLVTYGEQNVWKAGSNGLCGACTEIYYVNGSDLWEVLNVVFITHSRCHNECKKLGLGCVDIGIGLERLLAVLNGSFDVYSTDGIKRISNSVWPGQRLTAVNRILIDHVRCANAIITEGVLPANVGIGYVLRKLIRRCVNELLTARQDLCVLYTLAKLFCSGHAITESGADCANVLNVFFAEIELCLKAIGVGLIKLSRRSSLTVQCYDTFGVSDKLVRVLAPNLPDANYCAAIVYYNKSFVFAKAALKRTNCLILDKTCLAGAVGAQAGDQGVVVGASFGFITNHELVNGGHFHKVLLSVGVINSICDVCVIKNIHLSELSSCYHSISRSLVGTANANFECVKTVFARVNYFNFALDLDCGDASSLKRLLACAFAKQHVLTRSEHWFVKRNNKIVKFVNVSAFGLNFVEECCGTHAGSSVNCKLCYEFKHLSGSKLRIEAHSAASQCADSVNRLTPRAGGALHGIKSVKLEIAAPKQHQYPLAPTGLWLCVLRINNGLNCESCNRTKSRFGIIVSSEQVAMCCSPLVLSSLSNVFNRLIKPPRGGLLCFPSHLNLAYGLIFVKTALFLLSSQFARENE
uniref:Alanine--tRNA ligase n=1 Tax=Candidatus Hodgkinia cicadicola TaxID=573658 RepID=A0A097GZT6_9HYPH|nr:Alanine--tRNA ligase [Candidatus Hodgkinia cicadicola]